MEQNKQKTSQGEVWMDTDGILYQDYPPGAEISYEDSLEELEICRTNYCKEKRHPIIVDISNIKRVSKESRDIYSSDEMGNFYMGISKTRMPVRMFAGTEEAKIWIKDFLR